MPLKIGEKLCGFPGRPSALNDEFGSESVCYPYDLWGRCSHSTNDVFCQVTRYPLSIYIIYLPLFFFFKKYIFIYIGKLPGNIGKNRMYVATTCLLRRQDTR